MKPWSKPVRAALAAVALCALLLPPLPAASKSPLRSSFDLHVPVAPAPVTVAGVPQLVYELHLTNFSDEALTLARVRVLDERGGQVADMRGEELERRLGRPGLKANDKQRLTIAPGMGAVLYLEVPAHTQPTAHALRHRVDYAIAGKDAPVAAVVEGARVVVGAAPALVLAPPLRGGPWAAIHDPSWPRGHRRMLYAVDGKARIPGRYAIDWIKLDGEGRNARGDPDRVADWYGHGEDVLAVADGVVAATRDDMAESASVAAHPRNALGDATGNYVALDIGGGRHAFYEHLEPGSVRVRVGQRVRSGEVIGALGFTGDSTGPHLHFHVADANSPLGAEGVPYVFASFEVLGAFPTLERFGSERWQPVASPADAKRRAERPAPNVVVRFP
jgi:murein DD-endopeptidase